jgi:hypothetical protein
MYFLFRIGLDYAIISSMGNQDKQLPLTGRSIPVPVLKIPISPAARALDLAEYKRLHKVYTPHNAGNKGFVFGKGRAYIKDKPDSPKPS